MAKTGSKVKERERLQKAQEVRGKTTSVVIPVTFLCGYSLAIPFCCVRLSALTSFERLR